MINVGKARRFRLPRFWINSCASDEPPFNPREPFRNARSRLSHLSPLAVDAMTDPDADEGHFPVLRRCVSAQARICFSVNGGRDLGNPMGRLLTRGNLLQSAHGKRLSNHTTPMTLPSPYST